LNKKIKTMNNFHSASPILRVEELSKSIEYYQQKLGFELDWIYEDFFASVSRGSTNIMLSQGDQGIGKAWVYVGVGNVEELFKELKQSQAKIRQKPTNFA
jgi:hypothetical protein